LTIDRPKHGTWVRFGGTRAGDNKEYAEQLRIANVHPQ
jgi:hypothetical protein